MTPDVLTMQEAADMLRVTERTVRRMIKDGRLEAAWLGARTVRIPKSSVLKLLTVADMSGTVKT